MELSNLNCLIFSLLKKLKELKKCNIIFISAWLIGKWKGKNIYKKTSWMQIELKSISNHYWLHFQKSEQFYNWMLHINDFIILNAGWIIKTFFSPPLIIITKSRFPLPPLAALIFWANPKWKVKLNQFPSHATLRFCFCCFLFFACCS